VRSRTNRSVLANSAAAAAADDDDDRALEGARNTSSSCTFALLQRSIHGELQSPLFRICIAGVPCGLSSFDPNVTAAEGLLFCRTRRPGPLPQEEETYTSRYMTTDQLHCVHCRTYLPASPFRVGTGSLLHSVRQQGAHLAWSNG
jgi:hypothetical protein